VKFPLGPWRQRVEAETQPIDLGLHEVGKHLSAYPHQHPHPHL